MRLNLRSWPDLRELQGRHSTIRPPSTLPGITWSTVKSWSEPHRVHQGWSCRSCLDRRSHCAPYRVRGVRLGPACRCWLCSSQRGGWSVRLPQPDSRQMTRRTDPTLSEVCHVGFDDWWMRRLWPQSRHTSMPRTGSHRYRPWQRWQSWNVSISGCGVVGGCGSGCIRLGLCVAPGRLGRLSVRGG